MLNHVIAEAVSLAAKAVGFRNTVLNNRHAVALVLALSYAAAPHSGARASIIHNSIIESRYFSVLDDGSWNTMFPRSWQWWIQAYRTVRANPRIARKLAARPADMNNDNWRFKGDDEKLSQLGLIEAQIKGQPTYLYTLHIASLVKRSSLLPFLNRHWIHNRMERRKVYDHIRKGMKLFANGEFTYKNDPLYTVRARVRGHMLTRLCYGVYESKADANADRRVLERHLCQHTEVLRVQPTRDFIRRVWIEPVAGDDYLKWEAAN